ncbi:MAG: dihydroflavonol 4-reductase [Bacteroidetes bacterium CG12_big_fil_rev_8_21_14_0_65_60_17]|nr:MAG: dihydroflavonol 4-reductase [Bacteroidetes bacterium CG12_big_fil_rev_8_21_14_0_65_60_17]
MICFVTGGTGFLGSHLVRRLAGEGHDVRVLKRSTSRTDLLSDVTDSVAWIPGDLFDPVALRTGMDGAGAVFHAAAFVGFNGKRSHNALYRINVDGTRHTLNAALEMDVPRFVHVSSISALGRSLTPGDCKDENASWSDTGIFTGYAHSKYLAELEVHRAVAEGLQAVMVNPSLIMGPGRSGENTTQLVEQVRAGKLPFYPPGSTNVVDVDDVVSGIMAARSRGAAGERYILGGHNLTWKNLIDTLADALGVDPPGLSISPRLLMAVATVSEAIGWLLRYQPLITRESARISTSTSCFDNTRAKAELGFSPRPFEETAGRIANALS